jgi:hypothetical protein
MTWIPNCRSLTLLAYLHYDLHFYWLNLDSSCNPVGKQKQPVLLVKPQGLLGKARLTYICLLRKPAVFRFFNCSKNWSKLLRRRAAVRVHAPHRPKVTHGRAQGHRTEDVDVLTQGEQCISDPLVLLNVATVAMKNPSGNEGFNNMFELMGKSSIHGGFTGINSWKIHNPWDDGDFPLVNPCNLHQFTTLLQDFQGPQQDRPVEPVQNHPDDWGQNSLNTTPYFGCKNHGFPLRFCHASNHPGWV